MQEIKVGRPRQCLRFGDAGGEGVPGHDGLDGGERIAAALLGLNQRWPMRPYIRTLSLIALPEAWNCC
jgi:hypothetical protein